ncbi:S41 family peptidase [Bdellovibrionota bacterium FG-1]
MIRYAVSASFLAAALLGGSGCTSEAAAPAPHFSLTQSLDSIRFQDFLRSDPGTAHLTQPTTPDSGATPQVSITSPCDATCRQRRTEFRYVVYVGKKIYAYWDEKKAETHTDFEALASELELAITTQTSATEYFLILRRWAAAFHDGHVNALGKADDSDLEIYTAPIRLETLAPATDHEMVIISQAGNSGKFNVGDQVLAINGKPISEALDEVERFTSGSTQRMRRFFGARRLVDVMGASEGAETLTLTIQVFDENGAKKPANISVFRQVELSPKPVGSSSEDGTDDATGVHNFKALILPGGLGYLRIDAFSGSQSTFLLDQAMSRLQNTHGLLIDLRKNGGGDQSGNAVLSRLATSTLTRYATSERMSDFTLAQRSSYFFLPWTPGDEFAMWHEIHVSAAAPEDQYGEKPVIAITSPNCFSACDTFASALKVNQLATMVGEATGGGTGTPLVFELPYSGQQFRYSVVRGVTPDGDPLEGVGTSPDFVIEPSAEERANGQDQQLITALAMLSQAVEARKAPATPNSLTSPSAAMVSSATQDMGSAWSQDTTLSPSRSETRQIRQMRMIDEL